MAAGLCGTLRNVSVQLGACEATPARAMRVAAYGNASHRPSPLLPGFLASLRQPHRHGSILQVSELLLLAALAMLLPRAAVSAADEPGWLLQVQEALRPWRLASGGQPVSADGLGFSEGAAMALGFACGLLSDVIAPRAGGATGEWSRGLALGAPLGSSGSVPGSGDVPGSSGGAVGGVTELLEPGRGEAILGFLQARPPSPLPPPPSPLPCPSFAHPPLVSTPSFHNPAGAKLGAPSCTAARRRRAA